MRGATLLALIAGLSLTPANVWDYFTQKPWGHSLVQPSKVFGIISRRLDWNAYVSNKLSALDITVEAMGHRREPRW